MPINRQPPTVDELARQLAARVGADRCRVVAETIPATHSRCHQCAARNERSRRHCHLPADSKPRHAPPRDSGAFVPEMAARIDDDRNLSDGARRCARKIVEHAYRHNREGREAQITVTWLMKALGRSRRAVQRYLRQLERGGYIDVLVICSERTRMCCGLLIRLLSPLFPRHRQARWPEKAGKPGATAKSQIYSPRIKNKLVGRALWAFYCCEGVWRSYMKTLPPLPPFPATA